MVSLCETYAQAQDSDATKEPLFGLLLFNYGSVLLQESLAFQHCPGDTLKITTQLV
jgi:hypothetical protein